VGCNTKRFIRDQLHKSMSKTLRVCWALKGKHTHLGGDKMFLFFPEAIFVSVFDCLLDTSCN
jgi:hypothetical protein